MKNELLAHNIKWVRLLSGKKQGEFAELIGATKDTLYTYESGRSRPNDLILSKISDIAKVSIDDLINSDLRNKQINVVNPDTKKVEYTLSNNTQVQELREMLIRMEAENKLLKELLEKQLQKN